MKLPDNSTGVKYKLINRQYIAEGWRGLLDHSDRTEKINRFEPVINFGIRMYFRMIEE